jgi:phosphopantothenoylcysteine decarboxylase/phosphopantothenate--cysteine ligase
MAESQDRPLAGYETLLCVTGGIACYKSADLASRLVQAGAGVSVAMTEAATRFVAPLTFQTLTGRQVFSGLWTATEDYRCGHLALNERADLMIVAPATANIIAKMACGIADDLVSTLALSAGDCPVLIAPAMNTRMLNAQATQANIATLAGRGVHRVGPAEGRLACGDTGPGRMAEPDQILAAAIEILKQDPPKTRG